MTTTPPLAGPDTARAAAAAAEAATLLPSVNSLSVAPAQPGNEHVTAAFQGAVVAGLGGSATARIGVLVGEELVQALASSPTPGLELAAAIQPAIDAAARALGTSADAARQVEVTAVLTELGGAFTVVPLMDTGFAAALVVTDEVLAQGYSVPEPEVATVTPVPVLSADQVTHTPAAAPEAAPASRPAQPSSMSARRGIEMLHGVDMELTVELGRTRMAVRDLLALAPGDVLELDRAAGSPADLLVNGRLIARGEVVVVDEDFGLRITQILDANAG
jgi:flagellar motor switch protein FliN/FliY